MRAQMSRITRESTIGRIIKYLGVGREGMTGQGEGPPRASLVKTLWELPYLRREGTGRNGHIGRFAGMSHGPVTFRCLARRPTDAGMHEIPTYTVLPAMPSSDSPALPNALAYLGSELFLQGELGVSARAGRRATHDRRPWKGAYPDPTFLRRSNYMM